MNDEFEVKVEDLSDGCMVLVDVLCDTEGCQNIKQIRWARYLQKQNEGKDYYCPECVRKNGNINLSIVKLQKSKSFEQWCIENNRQDILDKWDYELNKNSPALINFSTNKKYYFKCPKGIHRSELKNICSFTNINSNHFMICNQCNSIGQYIIDSYGENAIDIYWSKSNLTNPFLLDKNGITKIWINCQNKIYHGSYKTTCRDFLNGRRCPYCFHSHGMVHPLDSMGGINCILPSV